MEMIGHEHQQKLVQITKPISFSDELEIVHRTYTAGQCLPVKGTIKIENINTEIIFYSAQLHLSYFVHIESLVQSVDLILKNQFVFC